jgi:osmoprotectant transport system permease protein
VTDTATAATRGAEESTTGTRWRDRLSAETAIVIFAIPVIVVIGFASYALYVQTSSVYAEDVVVSNSLNYATIFAQTGEHIRLTLVAAVATVLVAVPLGILLTRGRARAAAPIVVGFANGGQAAPSVGLIVLFAIWFGIGFWTAVLALTVYAVLPVLRNTIVGLQGVPPTLVEAGRGIGMSGLAVLWRVELPLALPVIMSGVRTALVLLVGTATLATFINGGGLGSTLQTGISLLRYPVIVWGAVLVALLALLIEWLGRVLELVARPKGV